MTLRLISLFANHVDHFINILLACIVVRCFHHNTNHRLSAGLTHQNTAGIAQSLSNFRHCFLHCRIILSSLLISYTDILQHLRIDILSGAASSLIGFFFASMTSIIFRLVRMPSPVLAYLEKMI